MKLPEDPLLLELFPEFIDGWIKDLNDQFMPAYNQKDTKEVYRIGHTLKGTCFQFGIDEIAQMGISMMDATKKEDWVEIFTLYLKIKGNFDSIKKELDSK